MTRLKSLLKKQTLSIDDHLWGAGEVKDWDGKEKDIHLEKETTYPIEGKIQCVIIKVPLNSERPIKIENKDTKKDIDIPRKLKEEIQAAFDDTKIRKNFINDLEKELKNYSSILSNEEKAHKALKNISKHFGLNWTERKSSMYDHENGKRIRYTELYNDIDEKIYYITINKERIQLGELDKEKENLFHIKNKKK